MPGLGCIWRFQVAHVAGESPPARLPTRSKASSRVRGITSFAESYGVLLLSDGDIHHKKPALVSALSSGPGPYLHWGRLQPPHLRALVSPARLQALLFSAHTQCGNTKEQAPFRTKNRSGRFGFRLRQLGPSTLRYLRTHHTRSHKDDPKRM